tara:strand:+ start:3561 stop:4316 length:756 start_codon:yes stop_codon:yes gene_type:complete
MLVSENNKMNIDDTINSLSKYMMTEYNINKFLLNKCDKSKKKINNTLVKKNEIKKEENNIFYPKFKDTLFWCFYIINEGVNKFFIINNNEFIIEKNYKIKLAETLKEFKDDLKKYKLKKSNIESKLVNDAFIDLECLNAFCLIFKKSIILIDNNKYYEFMYSSNNLTIIIKNGEKYGYYDNLCKDEKDKLVLNIKNEKWRIDNYNKPLKSVSSYTIKDLHEICNKLNIPLNSNLNKKKTKKELYEDILIKL